MRFGVHVSISGGLSRVVDRAVERGCETVQIFSSNPRSWQIEQPSQDEAVMFARELRDNDIYPLILHAPYLVNLGSPRFSLRMKSTLMLIEAARKAERLRASYLVFHLGSIRGSSREMALQNTISSLKKILEKTPSSVTLLLENMPVRDYSLGADFQELKEILTALNWNKRVGVCFDTCHAFVSGYDLATAVGIERLTKTIEETVSADRIKVVHANDSRTKPGSHRDLHADIGQGLIGPDGFKLFLRSPVFRQLPCILETPRATLEDDRHNLKTIRKYASE